MPPKSLLRLPGSKRKAAPKLTGLEKIKERFAQSDERLDYLERAVKDANLAKRLRKLWDEYPAATVPELVVIHWLIRRNISFLYQLNVRGGRVRQGGVVPDLIVFQDPHALVWMIQGNYWHNRPGAAQRDQRARVLLLGQSIQGRRVSAVVELWERRILEDTDHVCSAALLGISEGQ